MNTFKDDYYRGLCDNPATYDKVVDWIRDNNPSSKSNSWNYTPEEFAAVCVHSCIRSVIYGASNPMYSATGMCIAVRASSNTSLDSYNKVVLAIQL